MATEPSGILVPAYDYPGDLSDWDPAFEAASYLWPRRLIVVANPSNGPGYDFGEERDEAGNPVEILGYSAPDPNYVAAIDAVIRRCGMLVGYVHDCYNNHFGINGPPSNCPRTPAPGPPYVLPGKMPIEEDIARWFAAYPNVGGIFIDQVDSGDADRAGKLKEMVEKAYEKQWANFPGRSAVTVLNPGSIPSEDFMDQSDPAIVVIQEQSYDHFRMNWPPPGWVRDRDGGVLSIPARRLAIIAHTPQDAAADVAMLVDVARRYSIGSVYANHLDGSNYNTLSPHLVPLGKRICQLHNKFGLPCQVLTAPVCWGSQVLARVRSGGNNAFARR